MFRPTGLSVPDFVGPEPEERSEKWGSHSNEERSEKWGSHSNLVRCVALTP